MKKLLSEFKAFINKGNALALAIGVIIGGAFTTIVTTINKQVISPLIGALLGDKDLSSSLITVLSTETVVNEDGVSEVVVTNAIYWGAFIQSVIDFLLTAIILFVIFKIVSSLGKAAEKTAAKIRAEIEERKAKGEEVPEEEVKALEPVVSEEVLLLRDIKDLLANKKDSDE